MVSTSSDGNIEATRQPRKCVNQFEHFWLSSYQCSSNFQESWNDGNSTSIVGFFPQLLRLEECNHSGGKEHFGHTAIRIKKTKRKLHHVCTARNYDLHEDMKLSQELEDLLSKKLF